MPETGLRDYLRAAFRVPYNLILFFGGLTAGLLVLHPEAVWPFVVAGELLYLATLSNNKRFQAVVRAEQTRRSRPRASDASERLLASLAPKRLQRFQHLLARCRELQSTGAQVSEDQVAGLLESQQTEGVNKLLWVFLRTLVQEQILDMLSTSTPRAELEHTIARAQKAMEAPGVTEEVKAAQTENLDVLKQRLENLDRAQRNLQTIGARLERIENSIMLVQEQALTRRDPSFVEAEVKSVTEGLSSVEEVMRSMNLPQVDTLSDDAIPEFVMPGRAEQRGASK
jgi:hypothetical protein